MIKKNLKSNYTLQILMLCIHMILFSIDLVFCITVAFALLSIGLNSLCNKRKTNKSKIVDNKEIEKVPIGFFLCTGNIITIIFTNFIYNYIA